MSKYLSGGKIAGGNPKNGRIDNDYYATPPKTTELFLNAFDGELGDVIWESACGEGHISKVLTKHFPYSDIISTDLIDRGFGTQLDFLTQDVDRHVDTIITNPPFSHAKEFIERGLELTDKYMIVLAKIQLLEGSVRKKFFEKHPPKYVYVHSNRQATWRNGESKDENGKNWATTMCLAWFVFEKGYVGDTVVRWL